LVIRNFYHKGLKRLYEEDAVRGVSAEAADKLRKMLAFLDGMAQPSELGALPTWKAHRLTGDRQGTWSLHVTRNWRLTFRVVGDDAIADVDLEDDH
jgi:toxin HigB-1